MLLVPISKSQELLQQTVGQTRILYGNANTYFKNSLKKHCWWPYIHLYTLCKGPKLCRYSSKVRHHVMQFIFPWESWECIISMIIASRFAHNRPWRDLGSFLGTNSVIWDQDCMLSILSFYRKHAQQNHIWALPNCDEAEEESIVYLAD